MLEWIYYYNNLAGIVSGSAYMRYAILYEVTSSGDVVLDCASWKSWWGLVGSSQYEDTILRLCGDRSDGD